LSCPSHIPISPDPPGTLADLLISGSVPCIEQARCWSAFTRYCFTSKLLCGSPSSFHFPLHLHCPHTIAILLRDYYAVYDFFPASLLSAIHHTVYAMAISCKGQGAGFRAPSLPADAVGVVCCEIPRKENSSIFRFFFAAPPPASPGSPEVDPTIDQNKRPP